MKNLALFIVMLTLFSCSEKKKDAIETAEPKNAITAGLEEANWLLGKWEHTSDQGTMTEIWKQDSDTAYTAKSFVIKNKDTLFSESVRLVRRDENLVYIVKTNDGKESKPVEFALTSLQDNMLTFENPKHDFPDKIVYENFGDSLKAVISGHKVGVEAKEEFPMKKVNQ